MSGVGRLCEPLWFGPNQHCLEDARAHAGICAARSCVGVSAREGCGAVDWGSIKFLQPGVFPGVTRSDQHRVDILAETKLKGGPGIVQVHIESQAQAQSNFAE